MSNTPENLKDRTFDRLSVIDGPFHKRGRTAWLCQCSCGSAPFLVCSKELKNGESTSCGCFKDDFHRDRLTVHGMRWTPEYKAWQLIKNRCNNPKSRDYQFYGGRGIRLNDTWLNSFEEFYAHLGPRPTAQHSVDRINTNGNYEPGNVRWATSKEQNRNRRNTLVITVGERTIPLAQAAEEAGLPYGLVRRRVRRDGFSPEKALQPNQRGR